MTFGCEPQRGSQSSGNSTYNAREASAILAEKTGADCVQVIGSKFVLYKRNEQKPKIELVKKAKK